MLINGSQWTDTSGQPIHAHGGGLLQSGNYVYWFGENRRGHKRVSCYRSSNLMDWEFRGDVLTLDSPFRAIDVRSDPEIITDTETNRGANIERPKVIYHAPTKRYVMWMHWENGANYAAARCAVATCDTIDGNYTYHGSFNPEGFMSRDCTLFVDDDGTGYFISAARENADLHIYRLSEDYMSIDEHVRTLWPGQYREAPAVMKRNGVYFMVTSGCTGWEPNQGKYAYSDSLTGNWSMLHDFGGPTTFDTQPTYILPITGSMTTSYMYVGDRWDPSDYYRSSYVILPIQFPHDKSMKLNWADKVSIALEEGTVHTSQESSSFSRIMNRSYRYLASSAFSASEDSADVKASAKKEPPAACITAQKLSYDSVDQHWIIEEIEDGYVRIRDKIGAKCLEAKSSNTADSDSDASVHLMVQLQEAADHSTQHWNIVKDDEHAGWFNILHRATGLALTLNRDHEGVLHLRPIDSNEIRRCQAFVITPHYGVDTSQPTNE
ncbi:family 43 glycosylhydrolase [Paenibacillus sp. RC67]|uniref:family 43 glycosylhydrolase n=1 Tax=Paenibacillus sp. RC67 TaxID=3039392 RepID=UPI0024ADDA05|nr:family 43 glycosylhydrolase [Paenibacillus sp. RC67]